jgi:hypothetical protein
MTLEIIFGISAVALFAVLFVVSHIREKKRFDHIQPGKTFRLINNNPWAPITATVLEVKDGWVRFKWSDVEKEQTQELRTFANIYGE